MRMCVYAFNALLKSTLRMRPSLWVGRLPLSLCEATASWHLTARSSDGACMA